MLVFHRHRTSSPRNLYLINRNLRIALPSGFGTLVETRMYSSPPSYEERGGHPFTVFSSNGFDDIKVSGAG
jgi:hypothetical protein